MEYFNILLKTLDEVIEYAGKSQIRLGMENRFFYNEIPVIEEAVKIFEKFGNSPLGYWHDTGHAEIMARIGFVESQKVYLETLGRHLVGFHLHDLVKFKDHYAPGSGDMDFTFLENYMTDSVLKIIEAHPHSQEKEVKAAAGFLKKAGIE